MPGRQSQELVFRPRSFFLPPLLIGVVAVPVSHPAARPTHLSDEHDPPSTFSAISYLLSQRVDVTRHTVYSSHKATLPLVPSVPCLYYITSLLYEKQSFPLLFNVSSSLIGLTCFFGLSYTEIALRPAKISFTRVQFLSPERFN